MSVHERLPVALTKLIGPSLPAYMVNRPRLVAALERTSPGGVCLVVAPAGWGKSVGVAGWLSAKDQTAAWCRLDVTDRSPTRFWTVVCASIAHALPGSVDESTALASVPTVDIERHLIPTLINEILATDQDVWLVMDDTDRAASPENVAALSQVVGAQVPNLAMVIISRQPLDVGRGRLAVEGSLVEIRRPELAFDVDEVAPLTTGDMSATELVERTGGWPAGLVFETRVGSRGLGDDLLSDYLEREVRGSAHHDLWEFLVDVSVLDVITEQTASTIRPGADVTGLLRDAGRLGLTERTDGPTPQWRLVPLFGDFFRARLHDRRDAEITALELRAAEALAAGGDHHAALALVERAVAVDPAAAETLLHDIWLDALNHGVFDTIERVAQRLASRDADVHPAVAMAAAWSALNRCRFDAAQLWNARVRAALDQDSDRFPELVAGPALLDAHLLRHLGKLDAATAAARAAHALLDGVGDTPGYAAACTALGQNLFWSDPVAATSVLEQGRRVGERSGEHVSVITCAGHLGLAAALSDDQRVLSFDAAAAAIALAESVGLAEHHHTAAAHLALGLLDVDAGDADSAELRLERAMLLADRGREPYERSLAELVLADLARRTGSVTDAGVRLTQFETTSADLDRSAVLDSLHGRIVAETRGIGAEQSTNRDLAEPLTPRELAVLRLLRSPLTQREIANELFVSFNTSRTHTKAIYRKLGVASRSEAVAAAQRAKLL